MPDLRCKCGAKIAEYDDYEVRIMDKKCKTITVLNVVNGKLTRYGNSPAEVLFSILKQAGKIEGNYCKEIHSDENGEPYEITRRTEPPNIKFRKID